MQSRSIFFAYGIVIQLFFAGIRVKALEGLVKGRAAFDRDLLTVDDYTREPLAVLYIHVFEV